MSKLMLLFLMLASASALAQAPSRVRGTITAVDENTLSVDGKVQVRLGEKTEIVSTQRSLSSSRSTPATGRSTGATTRP